MAKRGAKKQVSFLTHRIDESTTRNISVRVEERLYNDFQQVSNFAATKGIRLTFSDVVRDALQAAVDEAAETWDIEPGQIDLPFDGGDDGETEGEAEDKPKRRRNTKKADGEAAEGGAQADEASHG